MYAYWIVAKNLDAAKNYAREKGLSNWRYANPPFMNGINNTTVIWLPGCEDNPHFREIKDLVDSAVYFGITQVHETG